MKLRLPGSLSCTTLGIALALGGVACGDDGTTDASVDAPIVDARRVDSPEEVFFCVPDPSVDSGGMFDGAVCGITVTVIDDCPPGCVAVG